MLTKAAATLENVRFEQSLFTLPFAYLGMVIHHSLNNTLWDKQRRLLDISNERAAREFTDILLSGVTSAAAAPARTNGKTKRSAVAARTKKSTAKKNR